MYPTPAANSGTLPGQGAGASWQAASSSVPAAGAQSGAEAMRPGMQGVGAVRIARRVLRTVVEQAALSVPGVARLGRAPANRFGPWRIAVAHEPLPHHGVALRVEGDEVSVNLFLLALPGAHLVEVGAAVQEAVGGAVEHILGMRVREVNVYVQDVA